MITKGDLEGNNFRSLGGHIYYYKLYEYCFDIKTQSLYEFNEKTGEKEFLCHITNVDKLKDLIE